MDRLITSPNETVAFGPEGDRDRQITVSLDPYRADCVEVRSAGLGRKVLVIEGYSSNVLLLRLVDR
jgi:hypothetical protein